MRTHIHDIDYVLQTEGVIARAQHPRLGTTIDGWLRRGRLRAVLPGVYARAESADTVEVRVAALMAWAPEAVLTDATAARVSYWPELRVQPVTARLLHARRPQPGFLWSRRRVPPELVDRSRGLSFTCPALTALDLCATHGGDGIDQALRRRATTLPLMRRALALTPDRPGNPTRRALLLDSRDEPWSAPERLFHRSLRAAGLTGWSANCPVIVSRQTCYLDVGFAAARLAIEIDGREFHTGAAVFESDRWRQNELVLAGWRVLRFTWDMIVNHPDQVITMVRAALAMS